MLDLDVIYYVTIANKWKKLIKNENVIYPTTSLPSFFKSLYSTSVCGLKNAQFLRIAGSSNSHTNRQS